jgi:hypothetical protein
LKINISGTLLILLSVWSSYCGRSFGFEVDNDILRHDMFCHVRILSKVWSLSPYTCVAEEALFSQRRDAVRKRRICLMPYTLYPRIRRMPMPCTTPQPYLAHRNRSISKLRRGLVSTCFRADTSQKLSCKVSTDAIQLHACDQRAATPASADAS